MYVYIGVDNLPLREEKMSFSFSIPSKPQSNRFKKSSTTFSSAAEDPTTTSAVDGTKNYVREFNAAEAPPPPESKLKTIAPIPNQWRPTKKLKNLPNLPALSQSNREDSSLQFELDPGSNTDPSDGSMGYGLNIRHSAAVNGDTAANRSESIADLELRKLREDLEKLPEDMGFDQFDDVPVEGFGAALLSGYGWKMGQGIGRNAKEDVKICEVTRKAGRGGLGLTGELQENPIAVADPGKEKAKDRNEKKGFGLGKEVRIVNGRDIGMKGKIVELRSDGDILVLKLSKNDEKVKVKTRDVAEMGSAEEEKCLRKLKELTIKEKSIDDDRKDRYSSGKRSREIERTASERVNWLRNHIRVWIVSKELKGGRLFLKKGVVMDVVGPGLCDISVDESRELIQGVDQDILETALPKRGGPVLVLYGRYKGVYGTLVERDSEKETGVVRDADTHELLNVKLEQIAEYTGDPSDIGYSLSVSQQYESKILVLDCVN